jgi:hypothetical protein
MRRLAFAAVALMIATPAFAQAPNPHAAGGRAVDLQGASGAWRDNPQFRAFYALTVESFRNGPQKVDFPTYQEKAFALFREFGKSMGAPPEAMVDHLKAIPGQMLQIVADDPHVLDSYDAFIAALVGPA